MSSPIAGIALILAGGIVSGSFTTPMLKMQHWPWECQWMMYSIWGMFILPWTLVFCTVDDLQQLYQETPVSSLAEVALFGAGWGLGSVLFGVGTDLAGTSLGFTIILGFTSTLGSAIPMVALNPQDCFTTEGLFTWAALIVTCVGLVFSGLAGAQKEKDQARSNARGSMPGLDAERVGLLDGSLQSGGGGGGGGNSQFVLGLIVCLASGLLSPMLNISLVMGKDIKNRAIKNGTSPTFANNPVWCVGVGAGFLINIGYCAFKLTMNGTWKCLLCGEVWRNPEDDPMSINRSQMRTSNGCGVWFWTFLMGVLWYGGNNLYGIGSNMLGDKWGTTVGWPIFIVSMILTGNVSGYMSGEWSGTSRKAKCRMVLSIVILAAAVVVGAVGSGFSKAAATNGTSTSGGSLSDDWADVEWTSDKWAV